MHLPHTIAGEHCVKSVRIRSFSGPYFSAFGLNTDQKNSESRPFSRSVLIQTLYKLKLQNLYKFKVQIHQRINTWTSLDLFILIDTNYTGSLSVIRDTILLVLTLREMCGYSKFFWSVFSNILTEYREMLRSCCRFYAKMIFFT